MKKSSKRNLCSRKNCKLSSNIKKLSPVYRREFFYIFTFWIISTNESTVQKIDGINIGFTFLSTDKHIPEEYTSNKLKRRNQLSSFTHFKELWYTSVQSQSEVTPIAANAYIQPICFSKGWSIGKSGIIVEIMNINS